MNIPRECISIYWYKNYCMHTYTIGRITGYTLFLYVEKTAVNPNKNIPTTKYIRSKSERAISKFENDCVKVAARRFPIRTLMLKIFPIMPTKDTEMRKVYFDIKVMQEKVFILSNSHSKI
jgi:hypothetical protein